MSQMCMNWPQSSVWTPANVAFSAKKKLLCWVWAKTEQNMPGLPEKIWSLVASTSKGPETFFFFFFLSFFPWSIPSNSRISQNPDSECCCCNNNEWPINKGYRARTAQLKLKFHLPDYLSEKDSQVQGEVHNAKYFILCNFIQPTVKRWWNRSSERLRKLPKAT